MNNYKQAILEQYLKNTQEDWRNFDFSLTNPKNKQEFYEWLKRRIQIARRSELFLKELGMDFNDINIIELGKGLYDSLIFDGINIGLVNPSNVKIITPYAKSFSIDNSNIINSNFNIKDNKVILEDDKYNKILEPINNSYPNIYLTSNPYSLLDIVDFRTIYNETESSIMLFIYGSNDDLYKDIVNFELDNVLLAKLNGDYIDIYKEGNDNDGGYYFRVIAGIKNINKKRRY